MSSDILWRKKGYRFRASGGKAFPGFPGKSQLGITAGGQVCDGPVSHDIAKFGHCGIVSDQDHIIEGIVQFAATLE